MLKDLKTLKKYRWFGHSALMGKVEVGFQDTAYVLGLFGQTTRHARRAYEQLEEKYRLQVRVTSLPVLIEKVAQYFKIDSENLKSASKERTVTEAHRVLCYIAVRKLGYQCTDISQASGINAATVSKAVSLGSQLAETGDIQKQILGN